MNKFICSALICMGLASCSTVIRGTTNQIQVVSNPTAANVKTSIGNACTTPCTFEVSRRSEFIATISKDGYKSVDVPVKTRLASAGAAGFAGNIVLGGVVGMVVDGTTGATLEHYPNPIDVKLEPNLPIVSTKPTRRPRRGVRKAMPVS